MAIKKNTELKFNDKAFTIVLAGPPGVGKTTLALSAPKPLLIDFDKGIARVRAEHRQLTAEEDSYDEFLADLESDEYKECETIILDTGGSLVQLMQPLLQPRGYRSQRPRRLCQFNGLAFPGAPCPVDLQARSGRRQFFAGRKQRRSFSLCLR